MLRLDNFKKEDLERLQTTFDEKYKLEVSQTEISVKGWNWGEAEFHGSELAFQVDGHNAFDLPLQKITNANLTGKQEVAVEFELPGEEDGDDRDPKKAAADVDQMVEMRFYIPGLAPREEDNENDEVVEEVSAAQAFYDKLSLKAEVSEQAGSAIVAFPDVILLTPRYVNIIYGRSPSTNLSFSGRYDVDMYDTSMRLRGKTYDYKVQYSAIVNMFLLPRSDEQNVIFVVGLDPPLRQGQTRYAFLIFQFSRKEETEVELNLEDEVYEKEYRERLNRQYDQPTFEVVSQIFRGLVGKRVIVPSAYKSHYGQASFKCNHKANEGSMYLLDRSALFVTKPTLYLPYSDISSITMSRVGASVSAGKTFDITFKNKTGTSIQFTSINREEQETFEEFLKSKGVRIKNDLNEDTAALLSAALGAEADDDDDDDVPNIRGDGDEDEESPDEDFVADEDDSEVADEFDSDVQSSGDEGSDYEAEEPKKKKPKKS